MLATTTPTTRAANAAPPRYSLDHARLGLLDMLVALHLPLQFALHPAFRRFALRLRSSFLFPPSTTALAAGIHSVLAHRQQAFRIALAKFNPRPHFAVSFVPPVDGAPFLAVSVHFITKDWSLISHVAELAPMEPGADVAEAVWQVVRDSGLAPDLLCGVTAALSAGNNAVVRTVQGNLHELVKDDEMLLAARTLAQPDLVSFLHGVAAGGVAALKENGLDGWLCALVDSIAPGAPNDEIYARHWCEHFSNKPETAARVEVPPRDGPGGKWTTTFDLYSFVVQHRDVLAQVLGDPDVQIAPIARPTAEYWAELVAVVQLFSCFNNVLVTVTMAPTLSVTACNLLALFSIFQDFLHLSSPQASLNACVLRMLAALREQWDQIMTPSARHALFLDPTVPLGPAARYLFLDRSAGDGEARPCAPEAFPARWRAIRDEILEDMTRTVYHDRTTNLARQQNPTPPSAAWIATPRSEQAKFKRAFCQITDHILRKKLNEELDKYETLADAHRQRQEPRTHDAALKWWREHGDQFLHLARAARRVLCVPATTTSAIRGPRTGVMCVTTARDVVVGRSLLESMAAVGVDANGAAEATRVMRNVSIPEPLRDEEPIGVVDLDQVRARWQEAVVVGLGGGNSDPAVMG
ncbi:hypothetical protein GGF32_000770 [Allomyces javanicus]|nr:hypothetical protein GGF32_000770 [Allomyces javanicus]